MSFLKFSIVKLLRGSGINCSKFHSNSPPDENNCIVPALMYTYSQVTVILKNETSLKETLKYKEEYIDFRGREHLVTRPSYY